MSEGESTPEVLIGSIIVACMLIAQFDPRWTTRGLIALNLVTLIALVMLFSFRQWLAWLGWVLA